MKKLLLLLFLNLSLRAEINEYPVMILGSGVGALTSAVYLARAGIQPVIVTGPSIGGTILQSQHVQNWPGEVSIPGIDLSDKVKKQAELNGALLLPESVVSVDFSKRPFTITTKKALGSSEELKTYKTQAVIIAIGATPNLLNIPGESGKEGYWSRGVYSCATCDGPLYRGETVAVIGGGDGALLEAEFLSNIAAKVHMIVRKDVFRAIEKKRLKSVLSRPNVEVHYETFVREIKGDGNKVTSIFLHNSSSGADWELPIDAVFLGIGSRPNTELFHGQLELDAQGYILLKKNQQTSVEGVFAAGDIADREFKQAISAAGDAAKAAIQTQKYLASLELKKQKP